MKHEIGDLKSMPETTKEVAIKGSTVSLIYLPHFSAKENKYTTNGVHLSSEGYRTKAGDVYCGRIYSPT